MVHKIWKVLVILLLHGVLSHATASPPEMQRGHRWVRNHPFTIMGLVRAAPKPFDVEQYREAGFSSLLAWEPASYETLLPIVSADDLPFHVNLQKWGHDETNRENSNERSLRDALRKLDTEENRTYIENLIKHPGCQGFLVNDEVVRPTLQRYTRQVLRWLRRQCPDALAYSNAHPAPEFYGGDFARYLDEFAAIVDPDVLMTDIYPLGYPDGTGKNYFQVVSQVRATALEHGMPYWLFIQSFETHQKLNRRLPSESDLRFQLFTALTYGYKGLLYFTYDMAFERGLIEKSGQPNRLYYDAVKANKEVAHLGRALRFLTSTDVKYLAGRHEADGTLIENPLPRGTHPWEPGSDTDNNIAAISIESIGNGKDGLIGFFQDDNGDRYFMLTNLWHNAEASSAERELHFRIEFTPSVKNLYRLNRISGAVEPVTLTDRTLQLTLPGGTGDLFKYDDETFPGE